MTIFIGVVLALIILSALSASGNKPPVVMCNSLGCAYNKMARCTRKAIAIYDNTVKGLCLYHTATMGERIIEPLKKYMTAEVTVSNPQILENISKTQKENENLVKNPKAFADWLKKHGIKKL